MAGTDIDEDNSELGTTEALRHAYAQRTEVGSFTPWIVGAVMGILALLGMLILSRSRDVGMDIVGFLLLVIGLVSVFRMIHNATAAPKDA